MSEGGCVTGTVPGASATLLCTGLDPMCAARRRLSTTEHGHAVPTRGYQSDPWSRERPRRSAPRSPPLGTHSGGGLTGVTPYQEAWHARHKPAIPAALRQRRQGQPPEIVAMADVAQNRLHRRYWRLVQRGKPTTVAATAVARELAGFVWAALRAVA